MAQYLIRAGHTSAGLERVIRDGFSKNQQLVEIEIEQLGGQVLHAMTFNGDYDQLFVVDLPDAESCAAAYLALSRDGLRNIRTSRVFTAEEMDAALRRITA